MKSDDYKKKRRKKGERINTLKKGVYILPNFLTSLSLFCGFFSIIATMQQLYLQAAWAIVIAALFDTLDGRIARITRSTSRFGMEYDSLSDLISFGVAPAVLAHGWVLNEYGRWGWLAAFLYVACGAMRLARFNVKIDIIKGRYFEGLPIPAAATMIVASIIFFFHFGFNDKFIISFFLLLTIYLMSFLMVSTIRFRSFKELGMMRKKPFNAVLIAILIIFVFASQPQLVLFMLAVFYVFSGPFTYILYLLRKKNIQENKESNIKEVEEEYNESK